MVRADGRAPYKVTSGGPQRGAQLICNRPVDKGVPCGSATRGQTAAECQTML